jgi:hypothetical protein
MTGFCDDCGNTACICPIPAATDAQAPPPAGGDEITHVDDLRGMLDHEILAVVNALRARLADLEPKYAALAAEVDAIDQATSWAADQSGGTTMRVTLDAWVDPRDAEIDALRAELLAAREALQELAQPGCRYAWSSEWGHGIASCVDLLRVIEERGSAFGGPTILPVAFMSRQSCAPCRARMALEARASAITFLPPSGVGDIENTAERYAEAAQLRGEAEVSNDAVSYELLTAREAINELTSVLHQVVASSSIGPFGHVEVPREAWRRIHEPMLRARRLLEARAAAGGGQAPKQPQCKWCSSTVPNWGDVCAGCERGLQEAGEAFGGEVTS